jgi:IS4 transposase
MAKLIISLDESLLASALRAALDRSQTLDAYITESVRAALSPVSILAETTDLGALLRELVERAKAKNPGERFYLDSLCTPEKWNALSPGARKSLGKEFRKTVEDSASPIASHQGRTTGNKAIYKRI